MARIHWRTNWPTNARTYCAARTRPLKEKKILKFEKKIDRWIDKHVFLFPLLDSYKDWCIAESRIWSVCDPSSWLPANHDQAYANHLTINIGFQQPIHQMYILLSHSKSHHFSGSSQSYGFNFKEVKWGKVVDPLFRYRIKHTLNFPQTS